MSVMAEYTCINLKVYSRAYAYFVDQPASLKHVQSTSTKDVIN